MHPMNQSMPIYPYSNCIVRLGIAVNIESLYTLDLYGQILDERRSKGIETAHDREVSIRVNPDVGAAHHNHCITGGASSKFGIYATKLPEVFCLITRTSHFLALLITIK